MTAFGSNYGTPGWQRAQANKGRGGFAETGQARYVREDDDAAHDAQYDATSATQVSDAPQRPLPA